METSATYCITSQNGTVIAADLPPSSHAIQLREGFVSKGDKLPADLAPGESTIVAYPLVEGRIVCRVTRMDGCVSIANSERPIEFVDPDPVPARDKPKASEAGVKAARDAIAQVKTVRRGRGRGAAS